MPLYVYVCSEHGPFTRIRKVDQREEPATCEQCGGESKYTPSFETQPPVFKGGGFHSTDYGVKEGSKK